MSTPNRLLQIHVEHDSLALLKMCKRCFTTEACCPSTRSRDVLLVLNDVVDVCVTVVLVRDVVVAVVVVKFDVELVLRVDVELTVVEVVLSDVMVTDVVTVEDRVVDEVVLKVEEAVVTVSVDVMLPVDVLLVVVVELSASDSSVLFS